MKIILFALGIGLVLMQGCVGRCHNDRHHGYYGNGGRQHHCDTHNGHEKIEVIVK